MIKASRPISDVYLQKVKLNDLYHAAGIKYPVDFDTRLIIYAADGSVEFNGTVVNVPLYNLVFLPHKKTVRYVAPNKHDILIIRR